MRQNHFPSGVDCFRVIFGILFLSLCQQFFFKCYLFVDLALDIAADVEFALCILLAAREYAIQLLIDQNWPVDVEDKEEVDNNSELNQQQNIKEWVLWTYVNSDKPRKSNEVNGNEQPQISNDEKGHRCEEGVHRLPPVSAFDIVEEHEPAGANKDGRNFQYQHVCGKHDRETPHEEDAHGRRLEAKEVVNKRQLVKLSCFLFLPIRIIG